MSKNLLCLVCIAHSITNYTAKSSGVDLRLRIKLEHSTAEFIAEGKQAILLQNVIAVCQLLLVLTCNFLVLRIPRINVIFSNGRRGQTPVNAKMLQHKGESLDEGFGLVLKPLNIWSHSTSPRSGLCCVA